MNGHIVRHFHYGPAISDDNGYLFSTPFVDPSLQVRNQHNISNLWRAVNSRDISAAIVIVKTLRPARNGWHLADDIFKGYFLDEKMFIISLRCVLYDPIDNKPIALTY